MIIRFFFTTNYSLHLSTVESLRTRWRHTAAASTVTIATARPRPRPSSRQPSRRRLATATRTSPTSAASSAPWRRRRPTNSRRWRRGGSGAGPGGGAPRWLMAGRGGAAWATCVAASNSTRRVEHRDSTTAPTVDEPRPRCQIILPSTPIVKA